MTSLKARDVRSNLVAKGFQERKGDHVFLHYYLEGHKTDIRTKISLGEKEIGDGNIAKMSKQIGLSKTDFVKFAECTMSAAEYAQIVRENGKYHIVD